MKNILVALSGGVDSSVAALLLKQQGFTVAGAYIKTWLDEEDSIFSDCPWAQDIQDAQAVAEHLGIAFEVVNLLEAYREKVVNYLVKGYQRGITPNPDLMCNREIKFGLFLEYALAQGFDGIATGHYCQRRHNPDGTWQILEGADKNKDQSYFLTLLEQRHIQRALFPMGGLTKPAVRQLATETGLVNARKKDSQGICFLGKVKINDFLKKFLEDQPGDIINSQGKVVGQHRGLHRYTLGQRKGIGVPSNADFEKYVVIGKDLPNNRLIIAFDHETTSALYSKSTYIHHLHDPCRAIFTTSPLLAKPRYRDPSQPITLQLQADGSVRVDFTQPQRALASGQLLAIYHGDALLGGGFYL